MNGVKQAKGFFNEFKAFVSQGNILDLAVGVVIGTAFKSIVSSLVADIIMPAFGALFGNTDISELKKVITEAVYTADGTTVVTPEVAIRYGLFIKYIIDFLIIAFCMFIVVKVAMSFRKKLDALTKKEAEEAAAVSSAPASPTSDEKMLTALNEIRDILKNK